MSDQEINIAIAEVCGWADCQYVESARLTKGIPPNGREWKYGIYESGHAQIPNYCNDLNAMHEAEKTLSENGDQFSQRDDYALQLLSLVGVHKPSSWGGELLITFYQLTQPLASVPSIPENPWKMEGVRMIESKHTLGPWIAIVPSSEQFHEGNDITHFSVYSESAFHDAGKIDNHCVIGMQFTHRIGLDTARANAHLIAAAPELLAALESMMTLAQTGDWDGDDPIEMASIAIAKAKGES